MKAMPQKSLNYLVLLQLILKTYPLDVSNLYDNWYPISSMRSMSCKAIRQTLKMLSQPTTSFSCTSRYATHRTWFPFSPKFDHYFGGRKGVQIQNSKDSFYYSIILNATLLNKHNIAINPTQMKQRNKMRFSLQSKNNEYENYLEQRRVI